MGELTLLMRQMGYAGLWRMISRIVFGAALLLMLAHLIVYGVYAVGLMRFPFDYDQGEGFELVDTVMFSKGEWPYQNNEVYPFYASNYPPLFHVLLVPFVWIFGPEYWYGRLVGFLGTLLTAGAIGWTVYQEGRHKPVAILSGLAFLASNYIYHVGPLFRQHMTMVLFETLAVVVLAHVLESHYSRRTMIFGLLLLLAAGYTKQHAVATVGAVFAFLLMRSPRRGISWGLLFAAVAGGLFLWINWATEGQWWANIISANVNQYIPSQFTGLFRQWFRLHWPLIVMSGLFAVYEFYFARLSLYTIWWGIALASTVLSGKWGAGDSYFATTIAATCLLSGLFAARTVRGGWTFSVDHPYFKLLHSLSHLFASKVSLRPFSVIIIPSLYLVYGLLVLHLPTQGAVFGPLTDWLGLESSYGTRYAFYDSAGWVPGYATIGHVPTQTDIDNGWRIVDILRESENPAMSEEAGFSLRADRDVITNPTQLKNLYENDLFDPSTLIDAIRQHDFSVVVFRAQFYPLPVVEAVFEAYYRAEDIVMNGFSYQIWRSGPLLPEREAFVAALEEQTETLMISLPYQEAVRWVAHALWHQNWQQIETQKDDPCSNMAFRQGDKRLRVNICPSEGGRTELTFKWE